MGFVQGSNALAAGKIKLGSTDIDKIYFGSTLAWSEAPPPGPTEFVSIWKTDNTSSGSSSSNQIKLPILNGGNYNFTVDWGDGSTVDTITAWNQAEATHTYSVAGTYSVIIQGVIEGWTFNGIGDRNKFLSVTSWGVLKPLVINIFQGCENLNLSTVSGVLDLSLNTDLSSAFLGCTSLTTINNVNSWDISTITNMDSMFLNATSFNANISAWDVSNVTNMPYMFNNATSFNQDLSGWCVTNITSAPTSFSTGATAWVLPKPLWGTCP